LRQHITKVLIPHMKHIRTNEWNGIPELTNKDNSVCLDSCPTQAWSVSMLIEGCYEIL